MEFAFGDHSWAGLEVVVLVVCFQGFVSGERAQGCVGSQLNLSCPEMKVISIASVVLGDSYSAGSNCYIRDNDCIHNATVNHTMDVHRRCGGQSNCTVDVIQKTIPCGYISSSNNDFERITYNCLDRPRKRAQGCVWSQLSLRCPQLKVIQITSIVLGDSYCKGASCCIEDGDCTYPANADHRADVHRRCDNQQSCTVRVDYVKIPCGYWGVWYYNDFERISYNCIDDPHLSTLDDTMKSTEVLPSVDTYNHGPATDDSEDGATKSIDVQATVHTSSHNALVSVSSTILGVGIVGVVCLIITVGIVASVFLVKVRRKKRPQIKSTDEAKTVDRGANRYEVIAINGAQSACPETAASLYCELEGVPGGRVQCGSELKPLYEPLVVYEQLE